MNGRNYRLVMECGDQLECDGFEVMLFSDWLDRLPSIAQEYACCGLRFPVVHADKHIGDWMSEAGGENDERLLALWQSNCLFAQTVHARTIVCHIWGIPESDAHMEVIAQRLERLTSAAQACGLDVAAENCVCVQGSPLAHFEQLTERYPWLGITLDTRPAQFHRELEAFTHSRLLTHGNIRHIHISDYRGGYKQWDALYPILQPGQGEVDFATFFAQLKRQHYAGSLTLEAPSMRAEGMDTATLNASLRWIRQQLT